MYRTVLYYNKKVRNLRTPAALYRNKKIRKFDDREQTDREQSENGEFKNWGHSNPLWIVGGAGQLDNIDTVQHSTLLHITIE